MPEQFAQWKGARREEIEWCQAINEDGCNGCEMCVTTCGRNVFDYDPQRKKAVMARPLQCMVGCMSCQVWGVYDAISFPDPRRVREFIKKKILVLAKKQVQEKFPKA